MINSEKYETKMLAVETTWKQYVYFLFLDEALSLNNIN